MQLSEIKIGKTFPLAGIEFIKFTDEDGVCAVVAKDILFNSEFGKNNNFAESNILENLKNEILPKLEAEIGAWKNHISHGNCYKLGKVTDDKIFNTLKEKQ